MVARRLQDCKAQQAPRREQVHPSLFLHADNWLKSDIVEPVQLSATALAALRDIAAGLEHLARHDASLCADMAFGFERAFGVKTDALLPTQTNYELAQARERQGEINLGKLARAAWSAAEPIIVPLISRNRCHASFIGFRACRSLTGSRSLSSDSIIASSTWTPR